MEYMKLIKLLYIADRTALDRMDYTITGDKYVSMDHMQMHYKLKKIKLSDFIMLK